MFNLSPLLKLFNQIPAYNALADALHSGELTEGMHHPLGVLTAARPALLAALHADLRRPLIFITARADRARILTEQIQVWAENPAAVYRLPDPDALPHERIPWGSETIQGRLAALTALVAYNRQPPAHSTGSGQAANGQPKTDNGPSTSSASSPPVSSSHPSSPPPLLVLSARALMSQTLPPAEFTLMQFKVGQRINLNEVIRQWVALGYQPEEVVEVPGSFSRRGGILDIFPPNAAMPVRIELFGDEIDSLRNFDPVTQRSEGRLQTFMVGPAIEPLPRYAEEAAVRLNQRDLNHLQPSSKRTFEEDIARLAGGATFRGMEYYLPFFFNGTMRRSEDEAKENLASSPPRLPASSSLSASSVLEYLPHDTLIFIEDAEELALVIDELETQARTLKRNLIDIGDLPADWPDPYFGWSDLAPTLAACNPLVLGFTPLKVTADRRPIRHSLWSQDRPPTADRRPKTEDGRRKTTDNSPGVISNISPETSHSQFTIHNSQLTIDHPPYFLQSTFTPAPAFGGQVKNVVEEIAGRKKKKERVVLVSRQAARLSHLLDEQAHLTVTPLESLTPGDPPPPSGSITLIHGMLIEGWTLRAEPVEGVRDKTADGSPFITVMSDSELFGWKKPAALRQRRPRRGVTPETFFADVNPGDLVVHIEHGIGRYAGLVKLDFEGVEREYLAVEYANNDKLYVPIHQADRLARYVGADEIQPPLNRLGSADWNTVKRRAKGVEDIAKELLEIYAKRAVISGQAFSPDTEWQREIEDAFPFVETEDQLRAIQEVKLDMEKPRPMDRLICGDVGFGKTEVALRAAFKAVMDGVQVAVLAPTTILAQQHYQTFTQRLDTYPVKIEMLSRFRTPGQQQETLKNLATGVTDIVIGTHRLLQKDIIFDNLGLLVIDEEQRFGVKDKEKLKAMRANVDVLTLTATPIPRTLHMSLSGVRDLSTIDTPPEERLPIQTTIAEHDEGLIRTAILRELDRGGQIFFVYNRVMGIEQMANRIRNIVPEARVEVAHGQMSERHLEKVMVDFLAGEFDVLVSTTIIENGLDMPNVNTIIIDRADRMGLAQLYQLRGRVGRGAVRAYAYLLMPRHHELNPDARKRLDAIAEASELGAGFRIAMRDLEIRGAGELLGAKQHGQIAAVGFDLYTRLLGQAVRELRGEAPQLVTGGDGFREEEAAYLNPLVEGVQINLPIPAYVPEDYLPEEKLRLRLYRRLAGVATLKDIDEMARELEDRFGDLPEPVTNLLYQLKLKILAMEAGVKAIITEMGQIIVRADTLQEIDRAGLQRRLSQAAKITPRQLSLPLHPKADVWQAELEKTLRLMGRMLHDPAG